jgi:hypothetical protein
MFIGHRGQWSRAGKTRTCKRKQNSVVRQGLMPYKNAVEKIRISSGGPQIRCLTALAND